jgi:hypothetical protein
MIDGTTGAPAPSRPIALETRAPVAGSDGEAAGMSQLLGQLAAQIAATVGRTT